MYDVNNIILKFQSDKDLNKFVQANLRESPFHRKWHRKTLGLIFHGSEKRGDFSGDIRVPTFSWLTFYGWN